MNKLNPIEDANKMAFGEFKWLENLIKIADGILRFGAYPNNNNALVLSNPIDTNLKPSLT